MTNRSTILGIGHYVPTKVVTNDDLAKLMTTSDEWIVQRTGIRSDATSSTAASARAISRCPPRKMALERAGSAKDIDIIIFATLSPDHNFPGSGCFLGHKLGLPGVPALDVRNQCSGFLYGLSIADAWVRAASTDEHPARRRRGPLDGRRVQRSRARRRGALRRRSGRGHRRARAREPTGAQVDQAPRRRRGREGSLAGGARERVHAAPHRADARRGATLPGDERQAGVPLGDREDARGRRARWSRPRGVQLAAIDLFVPHQANLRINQFVGQKLGIPESKMVHNIERYGNTTAATIPLGLSEAWREGRCGERVERALRGLRQRLHVGRGRLDACE